MSQYSRTSAIIAVDLFLESCAFYLVFKIISSGLDQAAAALPFWLVLVAVLWAFFLSHYVQTLKFSANLRGVAGLGITFVSLLGLSHLKTGFGLVPVGAFLGADLNTVFYQVFIFGFLVLLWWRGSTVAQDDVTLDVVRNSFQWGLIVVFAAVLLDSVSKVDLVNGFLVLGFFGVGLAGLSLARFSAEAGGYHTISLNWWFSIIACVSVVLALGLFISAAGLGGLDDVTRAALKIVGAIGLWVIKPVLIGLGYLAGLLVAIGNWISSAFGGGDLSGLERAQEQIRQFHENLRNETGGSKIPGPLVAALKWTGFLLAVSLSAWLVYRIYRFRRRFRGATEVEETRENLLSWGQASKDLTAILQSWWDRLGRKGASDAKSQPAPRNPREYYHAMLDLSAESGRPRDEWQTPREHQGTLPGLLPMEPVERIVDGFQSAYYGGVETEGEQAEQMSRDWTVINQYVDEQSRLLSEDEKTDS